jgi:hypothetical protein
MNTPDPDPTELQQFGIIGVLLVGAAAVGILYALAHILGLISN